jgi:predicted nucleic acid-binding protein
MIFVDASARLTRLNQGDGYHAGARAFAAGLAAEDYGGLVSTDYVLDEAATVLRLRAPSVAVGQFRSILESSAGVEAVWAAPAMLYAAWEVLDARNDRRWRLTDCLSFVTMDSLGIRTGCSFDSDFAQAGFDLLPSGRGDAPADHRTDRRPGGGFARGRYGPSHEVGRTTRVALGARGVATGGAASLVQNRGGPPSCGRGAGPPPSPAGLPIGIARPGSVRPLGAEPGAVAGSRRHGYYSA